LAPMGSKVSGFTVKDLMGSSPVVDWNKAAVAYPHLRFQSRSLVTGFKYCWEWNLLNT
jgi:hypothetical protein